MDPVSKFSMCHIALLCVIRVARPMGGNSSCMCGWAFGKLDLCRKPIIAMSRRSVRGVKLNCKNATSTSMLNDYTNAVSNLSSDANTHRIA